jgi:arginine transport system permease protein
MPATGFLVPLLIASKTTLQLAGCALLLGLLLALGLTALNHTRCVLLRRVAQGFTLLLQGLPELLVLLMIYFVPTQLLHLVTQRYINFSAFGCGVVALALIFAAPAAETIQGALQAVATGQTEVATALGLPPRAIFWRIVLPQAWRYALPGLGNQWLVLIKDTALVSLIEINDLMRQTHIAALASGKKLTYFLLAAVIYLVITGISQLILSRVRQVANRFEPSNQK